MTSVLLVDDHILMRLGLVEAIESHGEMDVLADVTTGEEAIDAYAEHQPDVVVMDYRMPGTNGAEATAEILKQFPKARVLILSVYEGEEDIWRAVNAGAVGYLTKGADLPDLLKAVATVADGGIYFPAHIAQKIKTRSKRNHLTPRETDVLQHLVAGMSSKEIASEINVSRTTVKRHLTNIFIKLDVQDRTQAVLAAVQRGIVHLDD